MQIKKINNDKLKIILSSSDLDEKNIDIDTFLSNPIDSQNLFFEILDLAEEKYNFDIENNKAIIETISLDNNKIFILTITKIKTESFTYNDPTKTFCFENSDDLLKFYSYLKKNNIDFPNASTFQFLGKYYLSLNEENAFFENLLLEFSDVYNNFQLSKDIFIEYGKNI